MARPIPPVISTVESRATQLADDERNNVCKGKKVFLCDGALTIHSVLEFANEEEAVLIINNLRLPHMENTVQEIQLRSVKTALS